MPTPARSSGMWGAFGNTPIDVPAPRGGGGARCRAAPPAARARAAARGGASAGGGRGAAPALDTEGLGSGSSAGRCTPSRSRTTDSSTWPTVRTAACRCSRRTASTSRRCSSTARVRRRSRRPGWRSRPTRSSSSSTSPTTATRTSPCSIARACRCSISSGERSEKPGDFQGLHHMADRLQGQHLHRRSRAGRARAAIRASRDCRDTLPPNAVTAICSAARHRAHVSGARFQPARAAAIPPWTSTMASPYHDDAELAAARRHQAGRRDRHHSRRQGRHLAASPLGAADPAHRRVGRGRSPLRQRHVRAGARLLPGPRRQLLGGRQRSVRRTARRRRAAASSCSSSVPTARCC